MLGLEQLCQHTNYPRDSEGKSLQSSWCVQTRYKNAVDDDDDDDDSLHLLINCLLLLFINCLVWCPHCAKSFIPINSLNFYNSV